MHANQPHLGLSFMLLVSHISHPYSQFDMQMNIADNFLWWFWKQQLVNL